MIPADLSFHDATIAAIRREGSGYVLDVEDVAVDHGDDGEILELEELPGPVIRIYVIWTHYASQDEAQNLYLIECNGMRWDAAE